MTCSWASGTAEFLVAVRSTPPWLVLKVRNVGRICDSLWLQTARLQRVCKTTSLRLLMGWMPLSQAFQFVQVGKAEVDCAEVLEQSASTRCVWLSHEGKQWRGSSNCACHTLGVLCTP